MRVRFINVHRDYEAFIFIPGIDLCWGEKSLVIGWLIFAVKFSWGEE